MFDRVGKTDPVTRGIEITVNYLGIQFDVRSMHMSKYSQMHVGACNNSHISQCMASCRDDCWDIIASLPLFLTSEPAND